GKGLTFDSPLDALQTVSSDPQCKQKLRLKDGSETTAIDVQRILLQMAERHENVLPSWAGEICALWRRVLDQLEGAPDSVATVLDWAIKYQLYRARAERSSFPFERWGFL